MRLVPRVYLVALRVSHVLFRDGRLVCGIDSCFGFESVAGFFGRCTWVPSLAHRSRAWCVCGLLVGLACCIYYIRSTYLA